MATCRAVTLSLYIVMQMHKTYGYITSMMERSLRFDVLLTVHLSIFISVINQLDAQNFVLQLVYFMPLHVSSTMLTSSGGQNCIIQPLVCIGVMIPDAV